MIENNSPNLSELERLLLNYGVDPRIYPQLETFGIKRLMPIQYLSIVSKLFEGRSLLLCAATSAGKTLVGELACIDTILAKKKRCLYLVPLKSLANEKFKDFQDRWNSLGVQVEMSTGDMSIVDRDKEEEKLKTVDLLITTYERADSILRSHPEWYTSVQVVVVDEVHNIGASGRGSRLEGFLLRLQSHFPGIQYICLSATIGNPEDLSEWLGCELIEHDRRPVPLHYEIVLSESRDRKIAEIVKETLQQRGSVLVFTPTRYEAERLSSEIAEYLKTSELLYLINGRELRTIVYAKRDEIGLQFDNRLFYSIPRGVAFHHAGLSYVMRQFIEQLFRQSLIRVITCTPTLSAGVNLPTKVVIIKDVGLSRNYLRLDPNSFHQMCGRAGRPGYDEVGYAKILATRPGEKAEIEMTYFVSPNLKPKLVPIQSQFMDPENLLEQYLVWVAESPGGMKEYEIEHLTRRTFWYMINARDNPDAMVMYLTEVGHYTLENILTRYTTPDSLQAARLIAENAVKLLLMKPHKLEGVVRDRGMTIKCAFSRDYILCGCGSSNFRNRQQIRLCRHLIKLAQHAFQRNPEYTKDIILTAVHEENLVDKLLKFKMIKLQNRRIHITPFGMQTYLLYLRPKTALWIRNKLPRIPSLDVFYHDLLYAYDMERKFRVKSKMQAALKDLLDEMVTTDLQYHMVKVADKHNIPPGDMEEFVETLRWLLYCFQTIAELDQVWPVLEYTQPALDKLIPRSPEERVI